MTNNDGRLSNYLDNEGIWCSIVIFSLETTMYFDEIKQRPKEI